MFKKWLFVFLLLGSTFTLGQPMEQIVSLKSMLSPRAGHTSTLLPNGKVLIAGGCISRGCEAAVTNSAELFDPKANSFRAVAGMTEARVGHQAVRLDYGRVLILGGWTGLGVAAKVEIFDSALDSFRVVGQMHQGRDGFTATRLLDGRVLITGGYLGAIQRLASAEIYDPKNQQFAPVASMKTARMAHSATLLTDGRVLITGGSRSRDEVLASAEIFDPKSQTFHLLKNMNLARHKHATIRLNDGRILIIGGSNIKDWFGQYSSVEIFDPTEAEFVLVASMNAARFKIPQAVELLKNGQIFVAGSDLRAEVFDFEQQRFRIIEGSFSDEFAYSTATRLENGNVLVTGGYNPSIEITNQAWLYLP